MKWTLAAPCLLLAGCLGNDHVLFVTDTGIGLNYDSKPPGLSVDYHRQEGYAAPSYQNGALPPVVGRLQSNLNIGQPVVQQSYATGSAAEILTGTNPQAMPLPLLGNSGKLAYFMTNSSVGFKVGFDGTTGPVPSMVSLGYKRQELSWIPVATAPAGKDCYGADLTIDAKAKIKVQMLAAVAKAAPELPANEQEQRATQLAENATMDCYGDTLASITINGAATGTAATTSLQLDQYFATGAAARNLATGPVKDQFKTLLTAPSPVAAPTPPAGK